jgi:hypothetical protein
MLGRHPTPSPLGRPSAAVRNVGEAGGKVCGREAIADGARVPKPKGGARPGAGRPRRLRKPPGRPPHVSTEESRRFVGALVTILNLNHEQVAAVMGLNPKTLRKHYRDELHKAKIEVDIAVGETILAKCLGGVGNQRDWQKADSNLLKFYAVTQLGWREKTDIELGGQLTFKLGPDFKDI